MSLAVQPWFVAIGASGRDGLEDIREVLSGLPDGFGGVVLVVLHRAWDQPSMLKAILERSCALPVVVASKSQGFKPGVVYIGEPDEHLTLAAHSLGFSVNDPGKQHRNRTVDLLFRSVARHGGERMIGVVLSGSLDDGSRGLAAIHEAGGVTMVLTPKAGGPGMPENAIGYDGPIDRIGSPREIAAAILEVVGTGEARGTSVPGPAHRPHDVH